MKFLKYLLPSFSKVQNIRILKNLTSEISINASSTIVQLLFPPLMIIFYGLENFGIWIFLTAIPSTLYIFNFNINNASYTAMSLYFNQNKNNEVQKVFINCIFLTLIFVFFLILITALLINFYDFDLKILKDINSKDLKIILLCIFLSYYIRIINSIFQIGISYKGRLDIVTYLDIFFTFFSRILILIFGFFYQNLIYAGYAFLIASVFQIIIYYFFFSIYSKNLRLFSLKILSRKLLLKLLKLSAPYYLLNVNNIIKNSFQIIILGIFFNAQVVGTVSTLKTLFYFLPIRIGGMLVKSLIYELTKFYAEKKINSFINSFFKLIKTVSIIAVIFISISLLFGEFVYNLWLNFSYNFEYLLFLLIIMDGCIYSLAHFIVVIQRAINRFIKLTLFLTSINCIIILLAYGFFVNQLSYHYLFIFNLIGSILVLLFNSLETRFLLKKIKYK